MILTAIATAVLGLSVHQFTKRWDRKPFNCELCVCFWVAVIVFLIDWLTSLPVFRGVEFVGFTIFTRQILYRVWATMF